MKTAVPSKKPPLSDQDQPVYGTSHIQLPLHKTKLAFSHGIMMTFSVIPRRLTRKSTNDLNLTVEIICFHVYKFKFS